MLVCCAQQFVQPTCVPRPCMDRARAALRPSMADSLLTLDSRNGASTPASARVMLVCVLHARSSLASLDFCGCVASTDGRASSGVRVAQLSPLEAARGWARDGSRLCEQHNVATSVAVSGFQTWPLVDDSTCSPDQRMPPLTHGTTCAGPRACVVCLDLLCVCDFIENVMSSQSLTCTCHMPSAISRTCTCIELKGARRFALTRKCTALHQWRHRNAVSLVFTLHGSWVPLGSCPGTSILHAPVGMASLGHVSHAIGVSSSIPGCTASLPRPS